MNIDLKHCCGFLSGWCLVLLATLLAPSLMAEGGHSEAELAQARLAADEAIRPSDREHVTPYFKRHPKLFAQGSVAPFDRLFHHRWTLDVEEDYQLLCRIFEHLYQEDRLFLTQDLLRLLDQQPELMTINAAIERGVGYQRSLAAELDAGWDPEN